MRKFMIDIINEMDIGPNATRVGVVQYSSQVQNVFSLKKFITLADMVKAIKEIIPLAQGTMTGLAIRYAMNVAFSTEEGARLNVPHVAVIVTDGRPQDRVAEVAAAARESGIEIYAVGVARADMTSLRAMASPPFEDHVFLVETFDLIHQFGLQFQDKLCSKYFPPISATVNTFFSRAVFLSAGVSNTNSAILYSKCLKGHDHIVIYFVTY